MVDSGWIFQSRKALDHFLGFSNESGPLEMLEAAEFENIEMGFLFMGEIINTWCSQSTGPPTTQVFTSYVDLNNFIQKRFPSPSWTGKDLLQLKSLIQFFKLDALKIFGDSQASNMATTKWHDVNHVVASLRDVNRIDYMDVLYYENEHKLLMKHISTLSKTSVKPCPKQ